jgi:hypothetical protein
MWRQDNNLSINVIKTKEMIGLQEKEDRARPILIDGAVVEHFSEFQVPWCPHHKQTNMVPLIQVTSGGQRSLLKKKLQVCESQKSCLFVGDQILIFHHNLQIN